MIAIGIDLGTSFIKVSAYDTVAAVCVAAAQYPEKECGIVSREPNWAEQSPADWWHHVKQAILLLHAQNKYDPAAIGAIGIAYQMHGLVCLDEHNQVLRDSIIWCDSRAVEIGNQAMNAIGEDYCLNHLLNAPGNFTASKLAWVKKNEPELFAKIKTILLPGDFIAYQLTGKLSTTVSALTEAVCWDFKTNTVSEKLMDYFGFDASIIPEIKDNFEIHGNLLDTVAKELGLPAGIPVSYKAGDQPNNAFSLNVMKEGEMAATAGTSGVIYAVTEKLFHDVQSRVNTFAHVNHLAANHSLGVLMCINGTGILYKYIRSILGKNLSYAELNELAAAVPVGSEGLLMLPFGNGAERILGNRTVGSHLLNLNFNIHTPSHIVRAALEGIAFAFQYGLNIMRENGIQLSVVKAPRANLFLSEVFIDAFVNTTGLTLELYEADGSIGAAKGACAGVFMSEKKEPPLLAANAVRVIHPDKQNLYDDHYNNWETELKKKLQ